MPFQKSTGIVLSLPADFYFAFLPNFSHSSPRTAKIWAIPKWLESVGAFGITQIFTAPYLLYLRILEVVSLATHDLHNWMWVRVWVFPLQIETNLGQANDPLYYVMDYSSYDHSK